MNFWRKKFDVPQYKPEDFEGLSDAAKRAINDIDRAKIRAVTPGDPEATITREPMPLAYRDLTEHDVFEIGGSLFIRMSDHAVCFHSSRSGYVKKGKWVPEPLTHVRLVTDLYAKVEGGMLTRGKFGDI